MLASTLNNVITNHNTTHFIKKRIAEDMRNGRCTEVRTRFPPEPNGFLHLGHAKAALLNHDMAREFGGCFFLRIDDTNPERESNTYIEAIERDIRWLGCDWNGAVRYTSDYFEALYNYAKQLIEANLAYVCALSAEEISAQRGTLTKIGTNSPHRQRPKEENIALFESMRRGEHADGSYVLRAKIDMTSPNLNMRDPVLYRVRHVSHPRTAMRWCIYPTYDFSHCLCDALEGITHSLCTLEFEDHRPLYQWFLKMLNIANPPEQIEFARLNLEATVMSKRQLQRVIDRDIVGNWDDPRLATISGLRRRGFPPAALQDFCLRIGVAKSDNIVRLAQLEHSARHVLNDQAVRAMCVLQPLKVRLSNWPKDKKIRLNLPAHPDQPNLPPREIIGNGEFYIETDDYNDNPPPKYRRLSLGQCVRLRGAWIIRCDSVERDQAGKPILLHCSYDADTLGVKPDYRIGGVIHWVSVIDAVAVSVRLFEPLFNVEIVTADNFIDSINPNSQSVFEHCYAEPSVRQMKVNEVRQFERHGYFCVDSEKSASNILLNRVVSLRDNWSRQNPSV